MKNSANICPECGENNRKDFIRCAQCNAYLLDNSPWQCNYNLYAISGALITLLILFLISTAFELPQSYFFNDPISQVILCLAFYGLFVVGFKWRVVYRQIKFFSVVRQICNRQSQFGEDTLKTVRSVISNGNYGSYNSLIAYQRLQWVIEVMLLKNTGDSNILEIMKQHSETDRDSLESSLYVTQFLIWLLPTAGFLGTVFGMTQALQSFSAVVAKGSDLGFNAGLMATAQGLGVAFHTTLVGLAMVIPLLAFTTALRRRAQLFLEQSDKFFLRLVSNLTVESTDGGEPEIDSQACIEPLNEQLHDTELIEFRESGIAKVPQSTAVDE